MNKILFSLFLASLWSSSYAAIDAELPLEVRIDLLREQLAEQLKNDNNQGIVDLIPQFRALGLAIPDNLYFLEGRALFRLGRALEAQDRLVYYLQNTGREGTYYEEAAELLLAVKEQAQIQAKVREEEERRRREELERRAEKARMLRIREAQRNLYALGFRQSVESGILTKPTREALAIYQIRRDLPVSGDVTDETLNLLKSEVPDNHTCDTLAGYSREPSQSGIPLDDIAATAAIPACNEALRNYPEVIRFQVQYARALVAGGRIEDAKNGIDAAIDKEYPEAEMLMGLMHQRGHLDPRGRGDSGAAMTWFRQAAEKSYAPAQQAIGQMYLAGTSPEGRSYDQAFEWFSKAAELGFAPAQTSLGQAYVAGRGVARDYTTALEWFNVAAQNEYAPAEYEIGQMYERGRGVKRDRNMARVWYRRASDRGHPAAASRLVSLGG